MSNDETTSTLEEIANFEEILAKIGERFEWEKFAFRVLIVGKVWKLYLWLFVDGDEKMNDRVNLSFASMIKIDEVKVASMFNVGSQSI